ncbi:MAG: energy-coupling factor ABC transporter ATP-binding protein [Treponema sp.]|jgi:energy-coupling factor transport system ATP-binding protein|nr:energy-coupling factor ABC transporter ATP-binding protein [Treponema sp.]
MAGPIIHVEDFSYIYPNTDKKVLDGVSFSVNERDFVGIVGCNKAGKSTLCTALVGILPYTLGGQWSGTIYVDGEDLEKSQGGAASNVIGIVFQDAESQFTQETVEDEIAFSMCNFGYSRDEMEKRIRSAAADCGVFDMLDRSPFRLSGGQQQRVAIACMLALKPRVIILDESTSQLDPIGRDEVFSLVNKLHAAGSTVIMVDHNIEKIAEYVDKVMVIQEGKIVEFDRTRNVFQKKAAMESYKVRLPQVTAASLELGITAGDGTAPIRLDEAVELCRKRGLGAGRG